MKLNFNRTEAWLKPGFRNGVPGTLETETL